MDIGRLKNLAGIMESAPSSGMSKGEKSEVVSKAKKGEDLGSKGKNFKKIEKKAAARYGSEEAGKKVAAAVMWKKMAKEGIDYSDEDIVRILEAAEEADAEDTDKDDKKDKKEENKDEEKKDKKEDKDKDEDEDEDKDEEDKDDVEESFMSDIRRTAGIETDPSIESMEEESDTFIVFESKKSPTVIGVFHKAEDAKQIMKKYKKAVSRGYKSK
jgi:cobalamin biosynthesis protein CobT